MIVETMSFVVDRVDDIFRNRRIITKTNMSACELGGDRKAGKSQNLKPNIRRSRHRNFLKISEFAQIDRIFRLNQ